MAKENLTKCSVCGAEMSAKAKVCPSCGAKNKKPFYKAPWFWILIIAVVIIIAIATGGKDDSAKKVSGEKTKAKTTQQVKTKFKVGEEVKLGDAVVKVDSVKKSKGGQYVKPKSGNEYVIVKVTIKNNGDDNLDYNVFDFKMKNSQGNITDSCVLGNDNDTRLDSGELAKGGSVSGSISFEAPKDDKGLVLIYQGNMFDDDKVIEFELQ